jgi:hypothetical protein
MMCATDGDNSSDSSSFVNTAVGAHTVEPVVAVVSFITQRSTNMFLQRSSERTGWHRQQY